MKTRFTPSVLILTALFPAACSLDAGGLGANAGASGQGGNSSGSNSSGGGSNSTGMGGTIAGSGGTASGGGNTSGTESNCLNGNDDDGDTLADCADPDCTTVECVPAAPTGWAFVRAALSAYPALNKATCPGGGAPAAHFSGPAECLGCDCIAPADGCSGPTIGCWLNAACPGTHDAEFPTAGNGCVPINGAYKACEIIADSEPEPNVGCTPFGGGPSQLQPFQQEIHVCADSSAASVNAGCSTGSACVQKASGPYADSQCIQKAGIAACPAGYPQQYMAYTSFSGTLSCSACDCSGIKLDCAQGAAAVNAWDNVACTLEAKALDGTCVDVQTQFDGNIGALQVYNTPQPKKGGFCTGGIDVGGFSYSGESTICCK